MLQVIDAQTTDVETKWVAQQVSFSTADIEQQIFYGEFSEPRYLKEGVPQTPGGRYVIVAGEPRLPGGRYVIVAGEPRRIIKERRAPLDKGE